MTKCESYKQRTQILAHSWNGCNSVRVTVTGHRRPETAVSGDQKFVMTHDIIYFLHNSAFKASKELRERLGVDDIALILQQNRMRWYGHVLRKDDDDWVKKCMEYEAEGSRPRGRPKRTWKEVVREDCQARKLNKEDAVDRCKW